ncbi:unnamed protein product [Mytilus coruscus]|uniref:G-protein coupled receptors family 1 profile domain-containing protein n=1 Tax=Mytilus coruscus TaxID=42192 RepID=A0A6J8EJ13_MYTCO|nr:unnamed protein product [Mytilus coruscus]
MDLESIFDVILRKHQKNNHLNSTDGSEILYKNFLQEDFVISSVSLVIICVGISIGIVGNILIIGGVTVYGRLRTTGNVFIVNLAVADLVVVTIVQPFNVIGIIIGPEFFHGKLEALCHMVATVCVMSCAGSMITLASVALNRYIFVCKNIKYQSIYSKKKIAVYIVFIWLLVSLIDLPNYLRWGGHTFDYKTMSCVFDRNFLPYTMFLSTLIYWIPLALVFYCYISIYLYVRRHRKAFRKQMNKCESINDDIILARQQQDIRMIRTFVLVVIIFILCWVPYFVLVLFDRDEKISKAVYAFSLGIGHCNSSVNSILYGATNRRFRKGYKMFVVNYCCMCFNKKTSKETDRKLWYVSKSSSIYDEDKPTTKSSSLPSQ